MPRLLTATRIAEFRNRLCDVAMQLLAEVGYEGFNMRELAARLGVSAMTAYRYFRDKEEILAAVKARAFHRFADHLQAASSSDSASTNWVGFCRAYVGFALQEEIYYRLMFDAPRERIVSEEVLTAEGRVRRTLGEQARALLTESEVSNDPELAGGVLWSLLHGLVSLKLSGKLAESEIPHMVAEGIRVMFVGYGGGKDPASYAGRVERQLESSGLRPTRHNPVRILPAAG